MVVTAIQSGHGQAMEGFLHLSEGTFRNYQRGSSEFFHAHEVAHQWWGHEVAWETYRDQWLSEAFASYSAMLFLEASMDDDGEEFRQVVSTYTDVLCGRLRAYQSPYARYTEYNDAHRENVGPIAVGSRAGTAEMPGGYQLQSYVKGPMVLHMLRTMLANVTGSDEVFIQTLRDFLAAHRRGEASTADFEAALSDNAPADWGWFFDQWIEGTGIPSYEWNWSAERAPREMRDRGEWLLEITVRQKDVPEGFRMPVPVGIELPGGQGGQIVMLVDQAEKTMQVPLPAKPKDVVFNANNGVLACTKKM
jgi:aminopeptidase N